MIRKSIQNMQAYKPPLGGRSNPSYLLLDFNERTEPVSARVTKALHDFIDSDRTQVYPEYGDLNEKIAAYAGVKPEQVLLSNGSDHGIEVIFRANCEAGSEVIIPMPSFAMFLKTAGVEGLDIKSPLYTADYRYPVEEVLALINDKTALVVICNPNNPTGTAVDTETVLKIVRKNPNTAILLDECYFEYTNNTAKDYIDQYPNLFITRTFSKTWGLCSLRIGYILSAASNIENLSKVAGPYSVNKYATVAASAALDDPSYVTEFVDEVLNKSKPLLLELLTRKKIKFWPSAANFVMFYPENAKQLTQQLADRGILVRAQSGAAEGYVRANLGTVVQTKKLISALEELI